MIASCYRQGRINRRAPRVNGLSAAQGTAILAGAAVVAGTAGFVAGRVHAEWTKKPVKRKKPARKSTRK